MKRSVRRTALTAVLTATLAVSTLSSALFAGSASAAPNGGWNDEDYAYQMTLVPGGSYTGSHGSTLTMQADGNLVLYRQGVAQWSSQTQGNPGAYATFQPDGNLVVYTDPSQNAPRPLWSSGTGYAGSDTDFTLNLEDRELSVRYGMGTDGPSASVWNSNETSNRLVSTDEMEAGEQRTSPNGRYVLELGTDKKLHLIKDGAVEVWRNRGTTTLPYAEFRMQGDGNAVLYGKRNSSTFGPAVWSTGTNKAGSSLVVQDDGNVVVYAPKALATWSIQTGTIR